MSDKVRISAVVQTYNAEKHLEKCLKALEPFDEILVVDMESTDATRDIAGRVGARVVVKERGEHRMVEAYRDFAIHEALYDWVACGRCRRDCAPCSCRISLCRIETRPLAASY